MGKITTIALGQGRIVKVSNCWSQAIIQFLRRKNRHFIQNWTSSEIGQNKLHFKLVFPISEEVYYLGSGRCAPLISKHDYINQ